MPKAPLKSKAKAKKRSDVSAKIEFRTRRFCDINFKLEHPKLAVSQKHRDTLPLPFGGEVKKYDMQIKGLMKG